MIRSILFPTDFSAVANSAFPLAVAIVAIILGANETTQLLKPLLAHTRAHALLGGQPVGAPGGQVIRRGAVLDPIGYRRSIAVLVILVEQQQPEVPRATSLGKEINFLLVIGSVRRGRATTQIDGEGVLGIGALLRFIAISRRQADLMRLEVDLALSVSLRFVRDLLLRRVELPSRARSIVLGELA